MRDVHYTGSSPLPLLGVSWCAMVHEPLGIFRAVADVCLKTSVCDLFFDVLQNVISMCDCNGREDWGQELFLLSKVIASLLL